MQDTLLMVFTGVLAAAVLIQCLLFFAIYRSVGRMAAWMEGLSRDLLRNAEDVSAKVGVGFDAIKDIAESIKPINDNIADAAEIVRNRVAELDSFLADATRTAQREILRIQDTIEIARRRVQETVELLHTGILAPVNEINAIGRALRVGLDVFFRRRKNPSDTAAQDEEMFI
jgi:hypothetical protein